MAPEPEILKRKRSRPSDWWAAAPTTPQQPDEPPAKKRGGLSNADAAVKGMKDAPAAGNRGKATKGKEVARDSENRDEDELQEKPVRRGRSSDGREELLGGDGSSRVAKKAEVMKGKGAQEVNEDQSAPRNGRKAATAHDKEQVGDTAVEKPLAKRRGRPSAGALEEIAEAAGSSKQSNPQRRRRPWNTEAEKRAVTGIAVPAQNAANKHSRLPAAEHVVEAEVEEPDEDPIVQQKRPLQRSRADVNDPVDELVDSNFGEEKKKKRRSGVEILEAEALALTTTEDYAKGRPRPPTTKVPSTDDRERGRKRTRHSDVHSQDVRPAASSIVEKREKGRARTRLSDAELQGATMAGPSNTTKISRHRDQRVGVEVASSRLRHSGPNKDAKSVEKRTKSTKGSSVTEPSQTTKKWTRPSNGEAVERVILKPSEAHKKVSKNQSQEENQPRKRKGIEKHPESPHVKRRRIEKPLQQDPVTPEPEDAPVYQHLQAITRRVSRQTIEAKWEPLPSSCIERISQLLHDLQRPVVVRYNDERKKTQSSTALQMISRRLISKISKGLPFPQGTRNHREDDFDFEKILDHNRALEAQITPVLHANELLKTQVSKELALLESERERLAILEANARTTAASRSEAARRLHALLQPSQGTTETEGMKDDVGLSVTQVPRPLDLSIQGDEHLQALVQDLHGHVDSIQGNIRQVEGVSQAISKSKAAIQATLFNHLDSVQYDEVVLGSE